MSIASRIERHNKKSDGKSVKPEIQINKQLTTSTQLLEIKTGKCLTLQVQRRANKIVQQQILSSFLLISRSNELEHDFDALEHNE